jgi:hypothetical protein
VLEIATDKSEHIKKLKKFKRNDSQTYTSQMAVFHMDPTGRISDLKKIRIDPNVPLTRIDWFEVQNWPANGWPSFAFATHRTYRRANRLLRWSGADFWTQPQLRFLRGSLPAFLSRRRAVVRTEIFFRYAVPVRIE